MLFAGVMCVSATPTTLAVHLTAVWILLHAWYQLDRSAITRAPVSVVSVNIQNGVSSACETCQTCLGVCVEHKQGSPNCLKYYLLSVDLSMYHSHH
jgi:hypothetical protein